MTPLAVLTLINDAATTASAGMQLVNVLTPLVQAAMRDGTDVPDQAVDDALAGLDVDISAFDAHIAQARAA